MRSANLDSPDFLNKFVRDHFFVSLVFIKVVVWGSHRQSSFPTPLRFISRNQKGTLRVAFEEDPLQSASSGLRLRNVNVIDNRFHDVVRSFVFCFGFVSDDQTVAEHVERRVLHILRDDETATVQECVRLGR